MIAHTYVGAVRSVDPVCPRYYHDLTDHGLSHNDECPICIIYGKSVLVRHHPGRKGEPARLVELQFLILAFARAELDRPPNTLIGLHNEFTRANSAWIKTPSGRLWSVCRRGRCFANTFELFTFDISGNLYLGTCRFAKTVGR